MTLLKKSESRITRSPTKNARENHEMNNTLNPYDGKKMNWGNRIHHLM